MGLDIRPFQTRHGVLYHYQSDRTIASHLRRFGEWAEEEIYLIAHFVREGDVALDIGANIGTHTVPLSRLVGPGGRVFSFEPQDAIFPVLQMNAVRNRAIANTTLLKAIVSDEAPQFSRLKGNVQEGNFGSNTFVWAKEGDDEGGHPLFETSIDALHLDRCDFIKIDVQGYEQRVIKGAVRTIGKHSPVIYFEQSGARGFSAITEILEEAGYELLLHAARPYNLNNRNQSQVETGGNVEVNVLALPRGEWRDVMARLAAAGIPLASIHDDKGLLLADGAPSIWSLPDGAYDETLLAPHVSLPSAAMKTVSVFDRQDMETDEPWNSLVIPLEDCGLFHSVEFELDLSKVRDTTFNIQCWIYSRGQRAPKFWNTALTNRHAAPMNADGNVVIRITRASLTAGLGTGPQGEGALEIVARSGIKASIGLRNVRVTYAGEKTGSQA